MTSPGEIPPECSTCGKRQWPVIHSCSGIPHGTARPPTRQGGVVNHNRDPGDTEIRNRLAEEAWGVLVAAQPDRTDDLNVIAHAIAGNLLPVVRTIAADELDAAAGRLDDGDWMGQQYGTHPVTQLRDRAAALRAATNPEGQS